MKATSHVFISPLHGLFGQGSRHGSSKGILGGRDDFIVSFSIRCVLDVWVCAVYFLDPLTVGGLVEAYGFDVWLADQKSIGADLTHLIARPAMSIQITTHGTE